MSIKTNMVAVPEAQRKGFAFSHPLLGTFEEKSWRDWNTIAWCLNQKLAERMREYGGPADQEEPPPGGTPVAMAMRRAA
jgi:hypothetical protein